MLHGFLTRRAAVVLPALFAGLLVAVLTFAPPPPDLEAQESTPGAPASVSLSRADGTVTANWPAVSGATKYHATYSADGGGSWHAPVNNHTNITDNSITFNADNSKSYIVGVRAGNDSDQWSGWRNSLSIGPFTPNPAPGPVSSVSLTRADGSLTASWDAVSGATKYHVTYTVNGSSNWKLAALNHAGSSIDISGVDNAKSYVVGVRAGNATGWSGWVNSPAAGPYTPPQPTPTPTPTPEPTPTPTPTPQPPPAAPTGLTAAAGDQSVTLTWNDPADSSITGYEYRTRYAGVAWGGWTTISVANSHTVTGLENGKEYRFKLRAVNAGGASKPGPQSAPWYVAATPQEPPPPAAPANVAVNPGSDSLEITWDAVSEATSYDVRAKAEGASDWHDVASNITGTSYTYTTSNTMDYVGVRARNANGASAWSDVSRMPSNDLLNVATGLSSGGASAQSVQAQSQLTTPTWGTITRAYDITLHSSILDLNWTTVNSATGYNIVCSGGGWYWHPCGWDDDGTVKYTSVPSGESQPVTVSHYRRGSESRLTPGDFTLDYYRSYMLSIRAVNADPQQASAWVNTPVITPVVAKLKNFTATRTDGQVTLSWTPNVWATGYDIYCDTYTSGGTYNPSYTLCATLTGQDSSAASHGVTITKSGGTHNWSALDDTSILDIKIESKNQWGRAAWPVPLIYPNAELTVSNTGATAATLTIANHSDNWYYKANAAPDNTCQGPVSGSSKDLTGLSAHTAYDYAAYSDRNCTTANELATAARFTTLSSVSSLGSTATGDADIHSSQHQAVAFSISSTAGSSKYILKSVTLPMKNKGGTQDLTVQLYEMDGSGPYSASSEPKRDALSNVTFSGTTPTSSSRTNTTWTCSGSGCKLDRGKTYFVTLQSSESSPAYAATYALTESETALPSGNGWSIGYGHYNSGLGTGWRTFSTPDYNLAEFVFAHIPSLTSSSVTSTGATLTISNWNEDWYYKATTGPHTTCQGPVSGASTTVSGLSANTTYTYTAYSDSTCTSANELATAAAFTTLSSVSNLSSPTGNHFGPISSTVSQAVAFTTGSNTGGYTLHSITMPLSYVFDRDVSLGLALHPMEGGGTYSTTSKPASTARANVTFSGTDPTTSAFTDTTYTCSGSGCSLSASTTYFVVATSSEISPNPTYRWGVSKSEIEVALPSDNGWSIGHNHYTSNGNWGTESPADWARSMFVFETD